MKAAILTFHAAHNYGAVLQAYALKCFLEEKNVDVSVLDYRPYYIRNPYALVPSNDFYPVERSRLRMGWRYLRCVLRMFLREMPARLRRRGKFEPFIRNALNLSSVRHDAPFEANYDYDVYVIGSDQVWNLRLTQGFDDIYWGNFKTKENARKVAYAVSMIASDILPAQAAYVEASLKNNFTHVSVREEQLSVFVRHFLGRDIPTVLDPTLLVDRGVWDSIAVPPRGTKKYVLVYALHHQQEAVQMAERIATQIDATVLHIVTTSKFFLRVHQTMPTPPAFVGLFKNAEFIVTESFHGTAFSIMFEKPFVSILRDTGSDARQQSVLNHLGLQHCLVLPSARPDYFTMNYDRARERLVQQRAISSSFLCSALGVNE